MSTKHIVIGDEWTDPVTRCRMRLTIDGSVYAEPDPSLVNHIGLVACLAPRVGVVVPPAVRVEC